MKTLYAISIAVITLGVSHADEPRVSVTKEAADISQAAHAEKMPDARFRVDFTKIDTELPDLEIPTFSNGMRTRVVDVRVSAGRAEIALQVDELGIAYYDYKLVSGKWILKNTKNICKLSGSLALALAQVDILEGGVVEVKYHEESSVARKSIWNDELINKDHKTNEKLNSERYTLREAGFELVGVPAKLRPKSTVTPKIEEQNKTQQDNR